MKNPLIRLTALALLAGTISAPAAYAATQTATFDVTAHVPTSCSVTAGNVLAFGDYIGTEVTGSTTISVTCTNGGSYTVGLDDGDHPSAGLRYMEHTVTPGNFLNYELYKEAGMTNRWGNSDPSWVAGIGTGSAQTLTVYGRIPPAQTPLIGNYEDIIEVTVTYTP